MLSENVYKPFDHAQSDQTDRPLKCHIIAAGWIRPKKDAGMISGRRSDAVLFGSLGNAQNADALGLCFLDDLILTDFTPESSLCHVKFDM